MKRLLFLLLALSSCGKSMDEKIKSAVEDNLKKTMFNAKSYEPVEWGKVDTIYLSYDRTFEYDSLNKIEEYYGLMAQKHLKKGSDIGHNAKYEINHITQTRLIKEAKIELAIVDSFLHLSNSAISEIKKRDSIFESKDQKNIVGYSVIHSFRGTNQFGGVTLARFLFEVDTGFKLTKSIEIKNTK